MASKIVKFIGAAFAFMWFLGISGVIFSAASSTLAIKLQMMPDWMALVGFGFCLGCFFLTPWVIAAPIYLFAPFYATVVTALLPSLWVLFIVPPLANLLILTALKEMIAKSEKKAAQAPAKKDNAA